MQYTQILKQKSLLLCLWMLIGNSLIASVPPTANFSTSVTTISANTTITFSDLSTDSPTSWMWSFFPNTVTYQAGTSATSQNPQVSFNASGTYDVTLIASNADGSNTHTKSAYVTVGGSGASLIAEDFSSGVPPAGWTVQNPDNDEGWESTTTTGSDGNMTQVARMDNYQYNAPGQEDYLVLPSIDLANLTNPVLYFDVAYAAFGPSNFERLHVDYSIDNGATFTTTTYDKQDLVLATVPYQGNGWGPQQASHWRAESVDLSAYSNSNVIFRFVQTCGYGNGLFIDNVRIQSADLPIAEFAENKTVACTGETILFTDNTKNSPTSWAWTFTPSTVTYLNGTSATSQNPQVRFDAAGTYDVSLSIINNNGAASTSKVKSIGIVDAGPLPFNEDFSGGVPPAGWQILNPDNSEGWELTTTTGSDGNATQVIRMDNYQYNVPGTLDQFVLPTLNIANVQNPELVFDVAYAAFGSSNFERLHIEYSTDCGANFATTTYDKQDLVLATVPYQGNGWAPQQASDWREERIDISAYSSPNTIFKFIQTNGYGNGLFIDNVRIEGIVLPVELVDFSAYRKENKAELVWQTASEINNAGFEIEWSLYGRAWKKIGFVEGAGNAHDIQFYQFTHDRAGSGINYYRLKQSDFDGTYAYSEIESVNFPKENNWERLMISPNPVSNGRFHINFSKEDFTSADLKIFDATGRLVHTQTIFQNNSEIQVAHIPNGMYIVHFEIEKKQYRERIMIAF